MSLVLYLAGLVNMHNKETEGSKLKAAKYNLELLMEFDEVLIL